MIQITSENKVHQAMSPGYPARYGNSLSCMWQITSPPTTRIIISFITMVIEQGYDFLHIGHGQDSRNGSTSLLRALSGTEPPALVITPRNALWLLFTTDSSVTRPGFLLQLNAERVEGKQ